MVLALYRPADQKARKYIIGQRESLVHARADQGAGVGLPAADVRSEFQLSDLS
jgi:hypothetical protein